MYNLTYRKCISRSLFLSTKTWNGVCALAVAVFIYLFICRIAVRLLHWHSLLGFVYIVIVCCWICVIFCFFRCLYTGLCYIEWDEVGYLWMKKNRKWSRPVTLVFCVSRCWFPEAWPIGCEVHPALLSNEKGGGGGGLVCSIKLTAYWWLVSRWWLPVSCLRWGDDWCTRFFILYCTALCLKHFSRKA